MCLRRLVHSDGSLFDLSVGGASQFLQEEGKRRLQRDSGEETEEKWIEEEEQEEYSCMFDGDSLSDHITGNRQLHSHTWDSELLASHLSVCRSASPSPVLVSWRLVVDRLSVLFLRLLFSLQQLQHLLWWLLELHIVKIISSYIIWVCVKEVRVCPSVCHPSVSNLSASRLSI